MTTAVRALFFAFLLAAAPLAPAASEPAPYRVEARSETLLAVGIAQGDRMTIRLSRVLDNAPVRDAAVTVLLRGVTHPTVAEADGSYSLVSKDLTLPGTATVEFRIARGPATLHLTGTLEVAAGDSPPDKNSARQLWWWVLNFAVCIGFLMLISRRRKAAAQD